MSPNDAAELDRHGGQIPAELIAFAVRREARAKELANRLNAELPPTVWEYFAAATRGDWPGVERLGNELRNIPAGSPKPDAAVISQVWPAIMEIWMAFAHFTLGEPRYAFSFGREIIASIPNGSIYFGGTYAGRGLVTALCRCQEEGDPFFTIAQDSLLEPRYLRYLREIYGQQIFIPSDDDLQLARGEHQRDFEHRKKEGILRPGEAPDNILAVWAMTAVLVKLIFDRNPTRQFFMEKSLPIEWMRPHLAPHGLILSVHREPFAVLTSDVVEKDFMFWNAKLLQMVGGWLRKGTPIGEVCEFAEQVHLRKNLVGFAGDPRFVTNDPTREMFCKLRLSIAELYKWRATHFSDPARRDYIDQAADFAFRQAFALNPCSAACAFQCVQHYLENNRLTEALLVARSAGKLAPENGQLQWLAQMIKHRSFQA
jgi:hypothetical protein